MGDRFVERFAIFLVVGDGDAGHPDSVEPDLGVARVQGLGPDRFGEITVRLDRISVDGAVGAAGVEHLGERTVQRCRLRDESITEVGVWSDDAVEHHRSQCVGVLLGVAEPDEGAVGEADVGDRVAAEGLPDRFEVRYGGVGADVGEEQRIALHAVFDVGGE